MDKNYNDLYVGMTAYKFKQKDKVISNKLLGENSVYEEGKFNYASPIIDAYGLHFMPLNNDIIEFFTQDELSSAVGYSNIKLETRDGKF